MKLHDIAAAAGVRLAAYSVLHSTNAQALSLARGGERGPLWVTAERQTQGRGRAGRSWVSEAGNLHASLLLTAPASAERWPQLSFVAALAAHDAISETAPEAASKLAIKWPNDLMLDKAKLGGILIEGESGMRASVAIGIGVNCVSHPAIPDYTATDLIAAGMNVSAPALFAELSKSMVERLVQWNRGEGFSSVRSDWLGRAMGIGEPISVRIAGARFSGHFEGLDDQGRLLLRLPNDRISIISTGDVIVAPAPVSSSA